MERFHLAMSLLFVLVEEMNNSATWRPSAPLLWQCSYFLAAEVVIGAPPTHYTCLPCLWA